MRRESRSASITEATPSSPTGGQTQSASGLDALVGVRDRDAVAGPLEQLEVVLAVAEGERLLGARSRAGAARNASPEAFETPSAANSRKNGSDFDTQSRPAKRSRSATPSSSSASGSPMQTSFVGGSASQRVEVADGVERRSRWKSRSARDSGVTPAT